MHVSSYCGIACHIVKEGRDFCGGKRLCREVVHPKAAVGCQQCHRFSWKTDCAVSISCEHTILLSHEGNADEDLHRRREICIIILADFPCFCIVYRSLYRLLVKVDCKLNGMESFVFVNLCWKILDSLSPAKEWESSAVKRDQKFVL